jgi:hypothetical protein
VIPTLDLLERMQFVHDNIEYCFAEGRMMDSAIFFVLDNAADRIALDEYSTRKELWELAERLATRYGFAQQSLADSSWIKLETNGECLIWIDQANIINESNRRLFGSRD